MNTPSILITMILLLKSGCTNDLFAKDITAVSEISISEVLDVSLQDSVISKEASVVEYIKSKKRFILITDTSNIPLSIKSYYDNILIYLNNNKLNVENYYFSNVGNYNRKGIFNIPIFHYDGMRISKEIEELNNFSKALGESGFKMLEKNPSGKDAVLEINIRTHKVTKFRIIQ